MLDLGLSADQYRQFMATLATGYQYKTTVQLLTPEHAVVRTVSHVLMDGQVDVTMPSFNSGDVEVSRTARLTFLDRDQSLALDSSSPSDGAFYMDRMIRAVYSVLCPFGWVDVPVFTGPIVKVDRDGDLINVECQGKEWYALGDAWSTGKEDGRKITVMTALLGRCGEATRYMDFPEQSTAKVSKPVVLGRESKLWASVWQVAKSINGRVLFYDGRGVCRAVPKPTQTAVTLRLGEGGLALSEPQISYSTDDLVNAVRVEGAKRSKGYYFSTEMAPSSHPLAFLRNGKRARVAGEVIENRDLKSTSACRKVAVDTLADGLMQHVDASIDTMPIPHLEPWDIVQISTPRASVRVRPKAFTFPLVQPDNGQDGTPMTIGALVNVQRPRRPIRKA